GFDFDGAPFTHVGERVTFEVLMASFVESTVKDFFAASKFLRRTLETSKRDRQEYVERIGEMAKKYNELIQRTNTMR
ncbi:MAG: hypothetical protein ABI946_12530, partial [Chthoniobacterales bacterium]